MSGLVVGQVLGSRYRVQHPIARGGMGVVYEADDLKLHRKVAIKVLRPELAGDATCRERFIREAHAAARASHPSLVAIYDLALDQSPAYFVLELIDGVTLAAAITEGPLPWPRATRLLTQVLEATACLHDVGVVHRDLKPSNVLVVGRGHAELAKVIDLGVAQLLTGEAYQRLTATGAIVGTPAYMAPEQLRGESVGPSADVWSAGVLYFQALTGELPFASRDLATLILDVSNTLAPDVRALAPDVPPRIAECLHVLLARDPSGRPSARSAAHMLRTALESSPLAYSSLAGLSGVAPTQHAPQPARVQAPSPTAKGTHTGILLGSRAASLWAARLAGLGLIATCLVGSAVVAVFAFTRAEERAAPVVAPPVGAPAVGAAPVVTPPMAAPAVRTTPSSMAVSYAQNGELCAPPTDLDPRLRSCIDVSRHRLGEWARYTVHLDPAGVPVRLVRDGSAGTPDESACIEAALLASRWPPPSTVYPVAVVILAATY